mmetsp:Transcript_73669/g.216161  ORF Transcript_73669/g.216161 Transcript_73669/m.216161 type:complete len:275 (-) Transcript_73669:62-886(-)
MLEAEEELLEEGVRPYLAKYGFLAADADTWSAPAAAGDRGPGPTLELSVTGHEEREGHTWYMLDCRLVGPGASARPLRWRADRRLAQLRELLHDRVKLELGGPAYEQCFSGAPFAHKGGVRGTTARLQGWCAALASGISCGTCPPSVVGLTLQFLEAPEPLSLTGSARASASSAAARVRGTLGAAAGAVRQRFEQAQTQAAEQASTTAMGFAATNPKAAKAASGMAMGFAKQNPEAAKAAGQFGAKAAFGCMRSSPAATMSVLKATARGASAVF